MAQWDTQKLNEFYNSLPGPEDNKALDVEPSKVKEVAGRTLGGVLKVIDILERPYYGLMNVAKDVVGGEKGLHPIRSAYRGVSGKEKTTFSDLTTEMGWTPETVTGKVVKGGVDFVGGVISDPLTWFAPYTYSKGLINVGGKMLTPQASRIYFDAVSRATKTKVKNIQELNSLYGKVDNIEDIVARVSKEVYIKGSKDPELYFAKPTMRLYGKEFGGNLLSGASSRIGGALKPILDKSIKVPAIKTLAGSVKEGEKTIGELFSPGYDIRNSRRSPEEKARLLWEREEIRSQKLWKEKGAVEEAQRLFNGMSKKQQEEVTFWQESLLEKDAIDIVKDRVKNVLTPEERDDFIKILSENFFRIRDKEVPREALKINTLLHEKYLSSIGKEFQGDFLQNRQLKKEIGKLEKVSEAKIGGLQKQIDGLLKQIEVKPSEIADLELLASKLGQLNRAFRKASPSAKKVQRLLPGEDVNRLRQIYYSSFGARAIELKEKIFNLAERINKAKSDLAPDAKTIKEGRIARDTIPTSSKIQVRDLATLDKIRALENEILRTHNTFADKDRMLSAMLGAEDLAKQKFKVKPRLQFTNKKFQAIYDNYITDDLMKMFIDRKKLDSDTEAILSSIKDKKVGSVVRAFNERMQKNYHELVEGGLVENPEQFIKNGFARRIISKGDRIEERRLDSRLQRIEGGKTIKETKEAFEKNEIPYKFETNAAKLFLSANLSVIGKQLRQDWISRLVRMGELTPLKTGEKIRGGNMEVLFAGKRFSGKADIVRELNSVLPLVQDPGLKKFWKAYDEIQTAIKFQLTAPWPSFHAQNFIGNIWNGYLGGNTRAKNYTDAFKLQLYARNSRLGKPVKDATIKLGDRQFKLSKLYEMAGETGVLGSTYFDREFFKGLFIRTGKASNIGPAMFNAVRKTGTFVEDNGKVALFFDRLAKGDDKFTAAQTVKKFLFDYSDLTPFEQNVLKRAIPFYTWMRKNIPLQFEQIIKNPGKLVPVTQFKQSVEQFSSGAEEKYLPDFLREEELNIRFPGNKYWEPRLPFQDLAEVFNLERWVGSTSPLLKGWFEIIANKNFFTGRPLADERLPESKFQREKWKNWALSQMRASSIWNKAKQDDKETFEFYLDFLFGLRTYPFDVAQGRRRYFVNQAEERRALDKLAKKKDKKSQEAEEVFKTVFGTRQ